MKPSLGGLISVPVAFWRALVWPVLTFLGGVFWAIYRHIPPRKPPYPQFREIFRARQQLQRRYDLRWARWLVTLASVVATFAFLWMLRNGALERTFLATSLVAGALMLLYFGHLLLMRLQCSLLEWCLIIVLLGNLEGLIFSTAGILRHPVVASGLGVAVAVWVLYGAALGLVRSTLCGASGAWPRVGLLLGAWLELAAPALVWWGGMLWWFGEDPLGPYLGRWGLRLAILGILGVGIGLWLQRRTISVARRVVGELPPEHSGQGAGVASM